MQAFKKRKINRKLPVEVYRNLNKGGYSIRQGGLVVAHSENVTILDGKFVVQWGGLARARRTGVRNVHAWVRGQLVPTQKGPQHNTIKVTYHPIAGRFFDYSFGAVRNGRLVFLTKEGCHVWRANTW